MSTKKRKIEHVAHDSKTDADHATKRAKLRKSDSNVGQPAPFASQDTDLRVARFCNTEQIEQKGKPALTSVSWDNTKIQCSLSRAEVEDQLLVHNIASGCIISGNLWPLVLEYSPNSLAHKRSLAFMSQVVAEPQLLANLTEDELMFFGVGVRDLWLADSRGQLSSQEKRVLSQVVELIDDDLMASVEFQGLTFSFCPSKHRRVLKAIEHLEELTSTDDDFTRMFASMVVPGTEQVSFYFVWVDARELSYHNLEFILPLDRALVRPSKKDPLDFKFTNVTPLSKSMRVVKCKLEGSDTELLLQLDSLGLYQKPSNHSTRGGERFVFSSAALSSGLTAAIKSSNVLSTLVKSVKGSNSSFAFVNYVFRCNRFAPGDAKFQMHLDTPYYDSARHHISKYTILIYLSGGSGDSILKVLGNGKTRNSTAVNVNKVETLECVIFDQQYEHEGQPFVDGNKIFLRSELVFEDHNIKHEPEISKLFSSAVYMTVESAFQPELSNYAHTLYEQVNAAHWGNNKSLPVTSPVLHKCFDGRMHFASNGFDYWFPFLATKGKSAAEDALLSNPLRFLKLAAIIAVLDYFNGHLTRANKKLEETVVDAFRKLCETKTMEPPKCASSSDWILSHLWSSLDQKRRVDSEYELKGFAPAEKKELFANSLRSEKYARNPSDEDCCCPFHCMPARYMDPGLSSEEQQEFFAWRCTYVIECYEQVCKSSERSLLEATVLLLDQKLCLDEARVVIEDDKIMITIDTEHKLRCNFAACWNWSTPEAWIDIEKTIPAAKLLVPPITFVPIPGTDKSGPGFRLMLDFFNNDWLLPPSAEIESAVLIPNMEHDGESVVDGFGLTPRFNIDY